MKQLGKVTYVVPSCQEIRLEPGGASTGKDGNIVSATLPPRFSPSQRERGITFSVFPPFSPREPPSRPITAARWAISQQRLPPTFTRSIIKNKEDLAIDNWADIGSAGTVHYGTANSLCLQAGSGTTIDVTPGLTTAGWQRSGLETSANTTVPDGCEVLWGNATASIAAQKLTVSAAAARAGRTFVRARS